jgi:hypothetical protein
VKNKIKNILILYVLLMRVLGNSFANVVVHDASKISIEKGAEGQCIIKAWEKVLKQDDTISDILRKDIKALEWLSRYGDNIPKSVADDLLTYLNGRQITEVIEDDQKKLVIVTQSTGSGGATTMVLTVEKIEEGSYKSFKYTKASNKGIPTVSANKLATDFSSNLNRDWLYPLSGNEKNIVKIKLTGKRSGATGDELNQ